MLRRLFETVFRNILGRICESSQLRVPRSFALFAKGRESVLSPRPSTLLADAELGDHTLVALGIVFLEVVKQATPLADQHEKSAA